MAGILSNLIKFSFSIVIIFILISPKDAAFFGFVDEDDGEKNIAGGEYAKVDQFPYQVAIISRNHTNSKNGTSLVNDDDVANGTDNKEVYVCSGAILTEKYVLSAAHCFDNCCTPSKICQNYDQLVQKLERDGCDTYTDMFIRTGVLDLNDLNMHSRQDREIKEITVPDEYYSSPGLKFCPENRNFVADIAIITTLIKICKNIDSAQRKKEIIAAYRKLAEPFILNIHVHPVSLARARPNDGQKCSVTGWGEHGMDDSNENLLKTAELQYILSDQHEETPSYIHIARKGNGDAVCKGDSGGPLVCGEYLSGVVSWGSTHCPQSVNVFTDVVHYSPWLAKFGVYNDF